MIKVKDGHKLPNHLIMEKTRTPKKKKEAEPFFLKKKKKTLAKSPVENAKPTKNEAETFFSFKKTNKKRFPCIGVRSNPDDHRDLI